MPKHLNQSSTLLLQRAIESGITSPKELANLMGNADVETRGFTTMHEDHRYRSAQTLMSAVRSASSRFSVDEIEAAVESRDPKEIFKIMYENRKDLGNTEPGDGYKYHGRGYLQYTGRDNYTRYGNMFGVDLKNTPEIAAEPEMAAKLAIAFWKHEVPPHQRENVQASAQIINGGTNGMEERVRRAQEWQKVITPELIQQMQQPKIEQPNLKPHIQTPTHVGNYHHAATDATLNSLSPTHQRLISDAHEHVHRLYQIHGMPIDQGTQNTVLSVAAVAAERGMTRIEYATVKEGQINLLQMNGMVAHAATIDGNVAANTTAEQSLNRLAELERNQAHSMHQPTQQMEQPHPVRSIT